MRLKNTRRIIMFGTVVKKQTIKNCHLKAPVGLSMKKKLRKYRSS